LKVGCGVAGERRWRLLGRDVDGSKRGKSGTGLLAELALMLAFRTDVDDGGGPAK